MLTFAIVGKTNVGKTTLFNAATLLQGEISNYPFTTKSPNIGLASVCDLCVCQELGLVDSPQNSTCVDGWRYVPIRIIDVPGLVRDAWRGRGLGNRFLSAIGQADALIHVVDASGSIDEEGKISRPGSGNPVQDLLDIELEIELWISHILDRNRVDIERESERSSLAEALNNTLTGIKTRLNYVEEALRRSNLADKPFKNWDARKNDITIEHVLNMTAGFDSNDMKNSSEGNLIAFGLCGLVFSIFCRSNFTSCCGRAATFTRASLPL